MNYGSLGLENESDSTVVMALHFEMDLQWLYAPNG